MNNLIEIEEEELYEIQGGHFWWGVLGGYIFGEIVQGIYQAEQNGCL